MLSTNIVPKKWGYEYCCYENSQVGIWHLVIKPLEQTSLHSHPNKKTGLIVLDGNAKLSFLSDYVELKKMDKRIIRTGVFHQTTNIGDTDLHLIEVETPNNKTDLLRLEDSYGRAGLPYEGERYAGEVPLSLQNVYTIDFKRIQFNRMVLYNRAYFSHIPNAAKLIILDGYIHRGEIRAADAGDVLDKKVFNLLTDKFDVQFPMEVITLHHV